MNKLGYERHYALVDDYIDHTDGYVQSITDAFIKTRFTGFLSVNAVTVYELCIKEIFVEFAVRKHAVFGQYVTNKFSRLNGRIKVSDLVDMAKVFGDKYSDRLRRNLDHEEDKILKSDSASILSSYGNIIVWRHGFAHRGELPGNATYGEAKQSYLLGKNVIAVLDKSMKR